MDQNEEYTIDPKLDAEIDRMERELLVAGHPAVEPWAISNRDENLKICFMDDDFLLWLSEKERQLA